MSHPAKARYLILISAFLGWMFAGIEMSIIVPATRPAIQDFLGTHSSATAENTARTDANGRSANPSSAQPSTLGDALAPERNFDSVRIETRADQWLSWFITAFFLGAAAGGMIFGWIGDRAGRVRAMGWSIVCFAGVTGLGYFARNPEQLLVLRFVACLGIGGMWPAGVSLVSEAWPSVSRPMLAGVIGSAANVGFLIVGILMFYYPITRESWRWIFLVGAAPLFLGMFVLRAVPESPRWVESRANCSPRGSPVKDVFRPPLLQLTLLGMALGTIPLLGGWASGQRVVPWAGQVGDRIGLPQLKAATQTFQSSGAVLGSLMGGWLASRLGKRTSYSLMSIGSLLLSAWIFRTLRPTEAAFPWAVFALGAVSTSFYGWLPYFLPGLFPTEVRATGSGISYNFGRIVSGAAVLGSTALSELFRGDIAKMGATTSLVYALGLGLVWFIPTGDRLEETKGHG